MNPGPISERTHRWQDWDLDSLVHRKHETRLTTTLVLPARNEAATIGEVVGRVRAALMEETALLDEIVVIDSDSTDETFVVATDAGAVVHRSHEIRPDLGTHPGKGEAMWKSLFVTRGDLIVFMDADLVDWDIHFVRGLLGPLLFDDGVALVKGFYERTQGDDAGGGASLEGGRVTELVARPLIALEWPELSWLVHPLAGEWAVRRDLFERLSVPTGYAVELAALVDTLRLLGPDALAQVDLGQRAHRHQGLRGLASMAAQILAASSRRSTGSAPDKVSLDQPHKVGEEIETVRNEIPLVERPPAVGLIDRVTGFET